MKATFKQEYLKQLELLLKILPFVANNNCFCLKGGTAINLFVRNMPRLSVDIDLTYVPLNDYGTAVLEIEQALVDIKHDLHNNFSSLKIFEKRTGKGKSLNKLYVNNGNIQVVIEPNTILRGTLHTPELMHISKAAETLMQLTVSNIPVLNRAELYAGKICAALDRQHPRDLFDVKLLYENGGLSNDIRQAFVVYVACNSRPMHELLNPNKLDISMLFASEFEGMTSEPVNYDELLFIRDQLITDINNSLSYPERKFLVSIKQGEPEWELLPFKNLEHLPALKWKVLNTRKMESTKHIHIINKLKSVLKI